MPVYVSPGYELEKRFSFLQVDTALLLGSRLSRRHVPSARREPFCRTGLQNGSQWPEHSVIAVLNSCDHSGHCLVHIISSQ